MSRTPTRDQRFVMLRNCERRRAEAVLAKTQADLARLSTLSVRLEKLRRNMVPTERETTACDLKLINEMSDQLLRARSALDAPLEAAAKMRDRQLSLVHQAKAKEENAEGRLLEARKRAQFAEEMREDANRVSARCGVRLRLVRGEVPC
jgi:hypothetical protein